MTAPGSPFWIDLEQAREQLLDAMSDASEGRWCAGWMSGLDRRLHEEGGIWEVVGRQVGWPLGYRAEGGWVSWDEAGAEYARTDVDR